MHGISSAAPSAARSPLLVSGSRNFGDRLDKLAEGRGFEPPRDLLGPYPISSRTPSTGLGHPSAPMLSSLSTGSERSSLPRRTNDGKSGAVRPRWHGSCAWGAWFTHTGGIMD